MPRRCSSPVLAGAMAVTLATLSGLPVSSQPGRITVREGDTLEQLALQHGVSLEALIRVNGISDPALLQVGQVLQLPGGEPAAAENGDAAPPPPDGAGGAAAAALLREQSGRARWKWFNATAVDWAGCANTAPATPRRVARCCSPAPPLWPPPPPGCRRRTC